MPSLRPALTLGALACATALALAGCSPQGSSPSAAPESSAASAPSETTAPSGAESTSTESTEASGAAEGSASPDESGAAEDGSTERWPAAVPVPPGSELGRASEGGVIAVSYEVADQSAIDAYIAEVEAAGFTRVEGIPETEDVTTAVLQNGEHDVTIVGASMGGQTQLQVTVAPHVG